jgi:hypothetical protein
MGYIGKPNEKALRNYTRDNTQEGNIASWITLAVYNYKHRLNSKPLQQ